MNRLCASGLAAVVGACHAVVAGDGDLFVAGGVESMSRAPLVLGEGRRAFPRGDQTVWDTTLGWRFPNPRLEELFPLEAMGETGENVAERWGVSREDQDAFALVAAALGRGRRAACSPTSSCPWGAPTATSTRAPTRARSASPRSGPPSARAAP